MSKSVKKEEGGGCLSLIVAVLLLIVIAEGIGAYKELNPETTTTNSTRPVRKERLSFLDVWDQADCERFVRESGVFYEPSSLVFRWRGNILFVDYKNHRGEYVGFRRAGEFPGASRGQFKPSEGMIE